MDSESPLDPARIYDPLSRVNEAFAAYDNAEGYSASLMAMMNAAKGRLRSEAQGLKLAELDPISVLLIFLSESPDSLASTSHQNLKIRLRAITGRSESDYIKVLTAYRETLARIGDEPAHPIISPYVKKAWRRARTIAKAVSSDEIVRVQHFLAALLSPDIMSQPEVAEQLTRLNIPIGQIVQVLIAHIGSDYNPMDRPSTWAPILDDLSNYYPVAPASERTTPEATAYRHPDPVTLAFSHRTGAVIAQAHTVSRALRAPGIISGALLIALADCAGAEMDICRFVRDMLSGGDEDRYHAARDAVLSAPASSNRIDTIRLAPPVGLCTPTVSKLLHRAAQIAKAVGPHFADSAEIQPHHLFAALIEAPPISVAEQFKKLGIEINPLRVAFDAFIREHEDDGHREAWGYLLQQTAPSTPPHAPSTPPSPTATDFPFSERAREVIARARELVNRRRGHAVTTSTLLFALAQSIGAQTDTCRFAREAIGQGDEDRYETALQTFLADHPASNATPIDCGPTVGPGTPAVRDLLLRAAQIAQRVTPFPATPAQIDPRHLFAALLTQPTPSLTARLRKMGVDLDRTRVAFARFLRVRVTGGDHPEWPAILGLAEPTTPADTTDTTPRTETATTPPAPTPTPTPEPPPPPDPAAFSDGSPGYNAEYCGIGGQRELKDALNVERLAAQLGDLIALRETKLPLAIGLFGNWGSGKSHFMTLLDQHIQQRAPRDRPPEAEPSAELRSDPVRLRDALLAVEKDTVCRQIVPIYFNAWHYLDANLWASLVSHIFDSLDKHLQPKSDTFAQMQAMLREAEGATARAEQEFTAAQSSTEEAQRKLAQATAEHEAKQRAADTLASRLAKLLPAKELAALQQSARAAFPLQPQIESLQELKETVAQVRNSSGRITAVAESLARPGWGLRVVAVLVILALPWAMPHLLEALDLAREKWANFLADATTWLATPLALVGAARTQFKKFNEHLATLEDALKQAEAKQETVVKDPEVAKALADAEAAAAAEEAARQKLAKAEARKALLEEEIVNHGPARRMSRFIEQRAQSADYRGKLNLISLARADFQELSNIFTDRDKLKRRVTELLDVTQPIDPRAIDEAIRLRKLHNSVDRIVLFIDDLDRCQPDKVVEVLEAVHLLLAFPLFAVVVGVDQRCLRHSLLATGRGHAPRARAAAAPADGADKAVAATLAELETATPLDYLEKIFHIPFRIPRMEAPAFAGLMHYLVTGDPVDKRKPATPAPPFDPPETATSGPDGGAPASLRTAADTPPMGTEDRAGAEKDSAADPAAETAGKPPAQDPPPQPDTRQPTRGEPAERRAAPDAGTGASDASAKGATASTPRDPAAHAAEAGTAAAPPAPPPLRVVPISDWELAALKQYAALIHTPRGATRFLNTYRLVRAGLTQEEWAAYYGDGHHGEFRLAMLLLAAAAGSPAQAQEHFLALRADPAQAAADPRLATLSEVYAATAGHPLRTVPVGLMRLWIQRVERYAF